MMGLKSAGTMIAGAMLAMGLTAGAALAETGFTVNVTLPDAINVGSKTLPSGTYQINEIPLGTAESAFVIRDNNGHTAAVVEATKTVSPDDVNSWGGGRTTQVVLSPDEDGTLRLNKMFIEGAMTGFQFINAQ